MKNLIIVLTICLLAVSAVGQEFSLPCKFTDISDLNLMSTGINPETTDETDLLNERVVEFAYDAENNLFEYQYVHNLTFVNSEDAINRNNKIYIPVNEMSSIVNLDCRVMLPNHEIRQLEKTDIKEGLNENEQKVYFFAVAGVEKGSCIEYYYLIKRHPELSGRYFIMQGSYPVAKSVFKIISPENLHFVARSLNGYSNFLADTSLADKNYLVAETVNIPDLHYEPFSNLNSNKMIVLFQLQSNTSTGKRNIYNFGKASQDIYAYLAKTPAKNAQKEIANLLKLSGAEDADNVDHKIFAIEQYVKSKFQYIDNKGEELSDLEFVMKNHVFNDFGAARLFFQLFRIVAPDFEIVVTTDRYDMKFDPTFDSWAYLNAYLFYFPSIDKFLSPDAMYFRLGLIPYGYTATYGLFIKKTSVGGIETGIGKVKEIKEPPAELSQSNIFIEAEMSPDLDSITINCTQTYTGYYAQGIQPAFDFIEPDKLQEFKESLIKQISENISIKKIKIENPGVENLLVKPLILKSTFTSGQLFDKAGSKILVRIGELIGPQAELYQESERILPVENVYNRVYNRELVFTIPDGYTLKNAEKLNMSVKPFENNGDAAGFVSSYSIAGNKLTIKIYEYYRKVLFPKEEYLAFRDVVNASSDFNKIMIILDPLPK